MLESMKWWSLREDWDWVGESLSPDRKNHVRDGQLEWNDRIAYASMQPSIGLRSPFFGAPGPRPKNKVHRGDRRTHRDPDLPPFPACAVRGPGVRLSPLTLIISRGRFQ